ncbi:sugar phosphate isomerase/epimerase [Ancylobacter sp. Lp-2]|uniref:sugar phosphate isomerase/epimerase family protein n=1 Tax=Ancylobacter sp. Lp-2 TaxID=2881339 RepID=UPI001E62C987|nr:sugar phosphate isomerase/epimerase family protein [Ancylobacter sp. Lp-2]MCB4767165.1 sugar phosphate isomerase/epimerase [Ancylobacter sp. Lp-2]
MTHPAPNPPATLPSRNLLGVHALVWVGDTSREGIEFAVKRTAETGYDLLELSLHGLDGLDTAHARATIAAAGLKVSCSRGLSIDADVSHEDPAVVERGAKLLKSSIEKTAALGGTVLTGGLFSAFCKYARPVSPRGRANAVAVLKDLSKDAAALGVTLGLEVVNRYETHVINTAAQALVLADEIGADNVMIHLDTYHMNIEEDDFVRPLHLVGDRLGYVHIGENHRGPLGSGHIDFTGFFHALDDISYAGPITFESFSSTVVAEQLSGDLAIWRNLWADGEALARQALAFTRAQIEAAQARPSSPRRG